jgi:AcrR family transcriptional regulator
VLDPAAALFVREGYLRTAMKAIAAEVGTSVKTVYAQGSKSTLLLACVDRALGGDDEDAPLTERAAFHRRARASRGRRRHRGLRPRDDRCRGPGRQAARPLRGRRPRDRRTVGGRAGPEEGPRPPGPGLSRRDSTTWRYDLEPIDGGTPVTHSYEITELPVRPIRPVYGVLMPHHRDMRPHIRADLEALHAGFTGGTPPR